MRNLLRECTAKSGGYVALATKLDVGLSSITRPFHGDTGYEVNLKHQAALLDEPAIQPYVHWLNLRTGNEPPVKKRKVRSAEDKLASLKKKLKEAGIMGVALLDEAAADLDIDSEDF